MKRFIKTILTLVICFCAILGIENVNAKEVFYTNDKGFELTQDEYNFFNQIYGKKFVKKYLDESVYNEYSDIDFKTVEVTTKKSRQDNTSRINPTRDNPIVYSTAKEVRMSKLCGILCRIVTTAEWYAEPSVKSYDDIGAYLDGPTRLSPPATAVYSSLSTGGEETVKYDTDGFGAVVQIPQGEDVVVTQSFSYSGTGHIYASYQHAMSTSSLAIAQQFNIDIIGFGNVFDFYGDAFEIYDEMQGVDLTV